MKKLVRLITIGLVLALFMIPANTGVVLADTDVTIQPCAADAYVYGSYVYDDTNYGNNAYLWTDGSTTTPKRFFMKFDLSSIPSGATITSAKLQLYYDMYSGSGDRTINVHRVQQDPARDWVEGGVTWNSYKSGSAWDTAGGDYSATVSASKTIPTEPYGAWVEWASTDQLIADVQGFLDNPNFGWVFKDSDETTSGSRKFCSKEYATTTLRPKLVVTYTLISDPPTVTTQDADGITLTTAMLHGTITDTGGVEPTRYLDWDTDSGEPYANIVDCGAGGVGAYSTEITGLTEGQTYYFRARAVNSGGTGTGSEKSFKASSQATFQPSDADAYIQQASPDTNNNSTFLCVQSYYLSGGSNIRSVLKFDMSSIPDNAIVTSASLSLYYQTNGGNDPVGRKHYAYRVTQTAWTEGGVTWNKYDGTTNWATAGGDYTETDGVFATIPSNPGCWVDWNVDVNGDGMKNQVQYALDNTGKVAHFLIKDFEEGSSSTSYAVYYCSKEYSVTYEWKRPKLVVEYTVPPVSIDITAPGNISGWNLTPAGGQPLEQSETLQVDVTPDGTGWSVTAKDLDGTTSGKMTEWTGSAYGSAQLGTAMQVQGPQGTATLPTEATIASGTGDNLSVSITFKQTVLWTDEIKTYRIVVTFTGSTE